MPASVKIRLLVSDFDRLGQAGCRTLQISSHRVKLSIISITCLLRFPTVRHRANNHHQQHEQQQHH
ncbi:hypothetical protein ZHAS_00018253 [Anopheles sinensis]|uniref:Uncharacterized protein n=1 Tax=Anopheles sinensis TaxID=74873 RepID=A0A084WIZ4_ANOSI|nr:hypothetical protein ZHAS_00018253 [Anopheles sinensis]